MGASGYWLVNLIGRRSCRLEGHDSQVRIGVGTFQT